VRDFELDRPVDAVVMKANNMPESPVEPEWVVPVFLVVFTMAVVVTKVAGVAVAAWVTAAYQIHAKKDIYVG
jgi:hypothetical protein